MRNKVCIFLNQSLTSGGGYNESVNLVNSISGLIGDTYEIIIVSTLPISEEFKKECAYECLQFKLNNIHRILMYLRRYFLLMLSYVVPGNAKLVSLCKKFLFGKNIIDKFVEKHNISVIHFASPNPLAFFLEETNYSLSVYDLAHITMPYFPELRDNYEFETRHYYYSNVLHKAFCIIVGHDLAKEQLVKYYNIQPEKIILKYFEPSVEIAKRGKVKVTSDNLTKGGPYIFYPAQFWAHKDHIFLLKVIQYVNFDLGFELKLILCGSDKGNKAFVQSEVAKLGINHLVQFLGFVSNDELLSLYKESICVVMPSYIGPAQLPVLEAIELGKLVFIPDREGFRNFYGNFTEYYVPNEIEDLSHKLASLIQNNMNLDIVTKSKPTQPKLSMDQSDFLKYKNKLDDIITITSTYRSIQDND
jgi:glycosyltransferase involved in cell wall biosynthesis